MKKTLIATAVAASVVAPISAFAVNLAADDAGEALIFPYYNVNQGNQTFIGVVNTTNQVKVLKVRFREGVESEDVFDFQLWLSPQDHWTAVIQRTVDGTAVLVATADTSCTVPPVLGNSQAKFNPQRVPSIYTRTSVIDRISEGHAEVIEMATVTRHATPLPNQTDVQLVDAVTHGSGGTPPPDCQAAIDFNKDGGVIRDEDDYGNNNVYGHFAAPAGGVYGIAAVFNPTDGTYFTYTAGALEQFAQTPIYYSQQDDPYPPGDDHTADESLSQVLVFDLPDISTPDSVEGQAVAQTIFSATYTDFDTSPTFITIGRHTTDGKGMADNLGTFTTLSAAAPTNTDAAQRKRDAVTTALIAVRVINDYLTGDAADGSDLYDTDWVFTFPGRYLHRGPITTTSTGGQFYDMEQPFLAQDVNRATGLGQPCEVFNEAALYGREEEAVTGDVGFSPGTSTSFQLCYEVNVIAINDPSGDVLNAPTAALGSLAVRHNAFPPTDYGWGDLDLSNHSLTDSFGVVHLGMPVVGFAAITERKGAVDRGGAFMHKITRGATQ